MTERRILSSADDVTEEILCDVEDALGWFEGERLRTEDFIDRLCKSYAEGWDIESYDNAAVRKIMRHARKTRAEQ